MYINAKPSPFSVARYINDCRHPAGYNAMFLKSKPDKCAWVITIKDLQPDEEIFADYGRWYWATIKPEKMTSMKLMKLQKSLKNLKDSTESVSNCL